MNDELRKKIVEALDSPIIGEMIFSDEEIEEMTENCRRAYRNAKTRYIKSLTAYEMEELVVLVVNICKQWVDESEGRFWVKLYNEIFEDGTIQPSKFYDDYEACLKRHKHVLFRSKENKRMFRETFLMHAFAPETSSDSFIKLVWKWYSDNEILNFDYRKEDDESIVRKFVQYLRVTFSDELDFDEDVSFEGNTYQIKSSFKYLFTQDPATGFKLLDALFESFNNVYRATTGNRDTFFWIRSSVVINKILEEARVSRGGRRGRVSVNHIIDDYSKIHIDYGFNADYELVLTLPEIRAIDESADRYCINIYNSDSLVSTIDGYVLGEGFRRKIKSREIPLMDLMNYFPEKFDLRAELILHRPAADVTIYDSRQQLIRDYVLFKSSREIRAEVCNPGTYYVALPSDLNIKKYTNCATSFINPQVSAIVAEEGTYVTLNDKRTFFSTKQKGFSQFIPEGKEVENLYFLHNGMELPVYRRIDGISVLSSDIINNPASVVILINNGFRMPLSDIAVKRDAILYVDLSTCENINYGYNKISFVDMSKQKVLRVFEFCANEMVKISMNNYSFGEKSSAIVIGGREKTDSVRVSADQDTYQFTFDDGDYLLYLPNIGWRIDTNEWCYDCIDDVLWHEEEMLHNNCILEIKNNSKMQVSVAANGRALELSDDCCYKLGDMLTELEDEDSVDVTLIVGKRTHTLLRVANKPVLEDFEIDLENKSVSILPYFVGREDSMFTIDLEGEEESYSIDLDEDYKFTEDIEDNVYNVTISIRDWLGDKEPVFEDECVIGNPDKIAFVDMVIALKQFKNPNGGKVKLTNSFIRDINYLRSEGYTSVYSGKLIIGKKEVPVEVHVRDDQVLSFFEVDGTEFKLLGYDLEKKQFTTKAPDGTKIIPCGTCYYKTEEA